MPFVSGSKCTIGVAYWLAVAGTVATCISSSLAIWAYQSTKSMRSVILWMSIIFCQRLREYVFLVLRTYFSLKVPHFHSLSYSFPGAKPDRTRARGASAFPEKVFTCFGLGTQIASRILQKSYLRPQSSHRVHCGHGIT